MSLLCSITQVFLSSSKRQILPKDKVLPNLVLHYFSDFTSFKFHTCSLFASAIDLLPLLNFFFFNSGTNCVPLLFIVSGMASSRLLTFSPAIGERNRNSSLEINQFGSCEHFNNLDLNYYGFVLTYSVIFNDQLTWEFEDKF